MRTSEVRLVAITILAVSVLVGAAYYHAAHQAGGPLPHWAGAAAIILGAAACISLCLLALRQEWATQARRFHELVSTLVTSPGGALATGDAKTEALLSPLRSHVDQLRTRVDQLLMQRKNLEIQLRLGEAERHQINAMICGITDAVLITDKFDELLMTNPPAAELFSFAIADAARKPLAALVGDCPIVADVREVRQGHGRANRRTLETNITIAGEVRTFNVSMTCMLDEKSEPSGVVTVLHDITREIEISRMKTDFVSHVSHELRTPLSSIKAYAELLVDGEATDEKTRQEFYHVIQGEADRLSRLIDNILNISRIESGMTRVNKKAISLTGLLKQALEVAMPSAREKNITLVDQIAPVFFQVEADRDMIYQAALNLVSNAIKYTPAGGSVKIILEADEAASTVSVKIVDTGVGIPADSMKHLFTKFYRVEQHKGMAKGSGLGLSLTKQIVESVHKGRMLVESIPGKGSTFGFVLPIAP